MTIELDIKLIIVKLFPLFFSLKAIQN